MTKAAPNRPITLRLTITAEDTDGILSTDCLTLEDGETDEDLLARAALLLETVRIASEVPPRPTEQGNRASFAWPGVPDDQRGPHGSLARLEIDRDALSALEVLVQTADAWVILGDAVLAGLGTVCGAVESTESLDEATRDRLRRYASSDVTPVVETARGRAAVSALLAAIEPRTHQR